MDALELTKLIQHALHTNDEGAVIIEYAHHQLHQGHLFLGSQAFLAVGNNATAALLILTGALPVHLTFGVQAGGEALVQFYEAPTASDNGTAFTGYNFNRLNTQTVNTKLFHTPTVSDAGTLIYSSIVAAGTGPLSGGANLRAGSEFILKTATKYYLLITNKSGNTHNYAAELQYYETTEDVT